MKCNFNCKRLMLGGLLAGVWIILVDFAVHGMHLELRYKSLMQMGYYHFEPALPFMPLLIVQNLMIGMLLAWLYAATRDALGPGACSAVKVGIVVGFIAALPANLSAATWAVTGKYIPFVSMLAVFAQCTVGTLIAGAVYKPRENSATSEN